MTASLLAPASDNTTVNDVFSSCGSPAAGAPAAGIAAIGAFEIPNLSSIYFASSASSIAVNPSISFATLSNFADNFISSLIITHLPFRWF